MVYLTVAWSLKQTCTAHRNTLEGGTELRKTDIFFPGTATTMAFHQQLGHCVVDRLPRKRFGSLPLKTEEVGEGAEEEGLSCTKRNTVPLQIGEHAADSSDGEAALGTLTGSQVPYV